MMALIVLMHRVVWSDGAMYDTKCIVYDVISIDVTELPADTGYLSPFQGRLPKPT
jgi:hypothetical protein